VGLELPASSRHEPFGFQPSSRFAYFAGRRSSPSQPSRESHTDHGQRSSRALAKDANGDPCPRSHEPFGFQYPRELRRFAYFAGRWRRPSRLRAIPQESPPAILEGSREGREWRSMSAKPTTEDSSGSPPRPPWPPRSQGMVRDVRELTRFQQLLYQVSPRRRHRARA
jgi:hypothetical protein